MRLLNLQENVWSVSVEANKIILTKLLLIMIMNFAKFSLVLTIWVARKLPIRLLFGSAITQLSSKRASNMRTHFTISMVSCSFISNLLNLQMSISIFILIMAALIFTLKFGKMICYYLNIYGLFIKKLIIIIIIIMILFLILRTILLESKIHILLAFQIVISMSAGRIA